MKIIELIFLAIGVSMDTFAVSICKGLTIKNQQIKSAFICGIWFAGFQIIMVVLGYLLCSIFADKIDDYDHWIAFALFLINGAKMLKEAIKPKEDTIKDDFSFKTMFMLSFTTSFDALAVGITFALLETNLFVAVPTIFLCTFILSVLGFKLGQCFGKKYKRQATFAGGLILILLGIKILVEGLI